MCVFFVFQIPAIAKRMCKKLMKQADRHCRNGELTVNEMRTFLKGENAIPSIHAIAL